MKKLALSILLFLAAPLLAMDPQQCQESVTRVHIFVDEVIQEALIKLQKRSSSEYEQFKTEESIEWELDEYVSQLQKTLHPAPPANLHPLFVLTSGWIGELFGIGWKTMTITPRMFYHHFGEEVPFDSAKVREILTQSPLITKVLSDEEKEQFDREKKQRKTADLLKIIKGNKE